MPKSSDRVREEVLTTIFDAKGRPIAVAFRDPNCAHPVLYRLRHTTMTDFTNLLVELSRPVEQVKQLVVSSPERPQADIRILGITISPAKQEKSPN